MHPLFDTIDFFPILVRHELVTLPW